MLKVILFFLTLVSMAQVRADSVNATKGEQSLCPQLKSALRIVHPPIDLRQAQDLIQEVIHQHYPELAGYHITASEFDNDNTFLYADVTPGSVLKAAKNRIYRVNLNRRLLNSPPSNEGLFAVLTHELSHIRDYTKMNSLSLLAFAIKYELTPIAPYERKTDLVALEKGVGCGLMEFRFWLYSRLDSATTQQKRINYYTPEEIAAALFQLQVRR